MKKTMIFLPLLAGITIGMLTSACNSKKDKRDTSTLPADVRPVAEAIIEDSPQKFAAAVAYPVERPYPLKNVNDSAEMVKYYPTMVDKKLKQAVAESPDSTWHESGWRGWTLGNGSYFYIDSGKIYAMNYLSEEEDRMLDSLRCEEIATLEISMQPGWTPVMCVVDTVINAVFRIDSQEETNPPVYRLSGYADTTDLSASPNLVLYGHLDLEGTMGNRYYEFTDSLGETTAYYSPDIVSEDDDEPAIEVDRKGNLKKYRAHPGYWLDQIKIRRKTTSGGNDSHIHPGEIRDYKIEARSLNSDTTVRNRDSVPRHQDD